MWGIVFSSQHHHVSENFHRALNRKGIYSNGWILGTVNAHQSSEGTVQFRCSVMSDSLRPHMDCHAMPPWSSPTPRAYSNSCPLRRWCHPIISYSVTRFSSCLQSSQHQGFFKWVSFFTSGDQSIGASASASVLPMNIQDWFPLGLTGWISL